MSYTCLKSAVMQMLIPIAANAVEPKYRRTACCRRTPNAVATDRTLLQRHDSTCASKASQLCAKNREMPASTRSYKHEHNGINFTFMGINCSIRASLLVTRGRHCIRTR